MPPQKPRYGYIDLLRGWAVVVMIEVHVVNAFMETSLRSAPWFGTLNFINGLVAPSFIFIAGYAFVLIGQRKWDDYLVLGPAFRKQVLRILQIWAVGYFLHIPFFSLRRLLNSEAANWLSFWKIDVLHAIAFGLLLLLLTVVIFRTKRAAFGALVAGMLGFVYLTPFLWTVDFSQWLPLWAANYINAVHGSQFPIFPWLGFLFTGGVLAQLFVWCNEKGKERDFFKWNFISGWIAIAAGIIMQYQPLDLLPINGFVHASPNFFFIRLGIVMIFLSSLWMWEQRGSGKRSIVAIVGSESLITYAGHLLVIYGMFYGGMSLAYMIGHTRTVPEVAGMTLLLIGAMMIVAWAWNWLKAKHMNYARWLMAAFVAGSFIMFALKEY